MNRISQKLIKIILICLLCPLFLNSCASTSDSKMVLFSKIDSSNQDFRGRKLYSIEIQSAGNLLSDGMVLAALSAGTVSNGVSAVMTMLAQDNIQLALYGKNDAITLASLRLALNKHPKNSSQNVSVYVMGTASDEYALSQLATEKGIDLVFFSY